MAPSELEIQGQALLQQKEAKINLENSISKLKDEDKILSESVKMKEINIKNLSDQLDKISKELKKKEKNSEDQQNMVERAIKEKNEKLLKMQETIKTNLSACNKKEESLESERQRLNTLDVKLEAQEKEVNQRDLDVTQKENSIKSDIEVLSKKQIENKKELEQIKTLKKQNISKLANIEKEIAKQKKIQEDNSGRNQEFQEIYQKVNEEKTQLSLLQGYIDRSTANLTRATALMFHEFNRLVSKSGTDMPYIDLIGADTQESVGIALLGNFYRDKKRAKEVMRELDLLDETPELSELSELSEKVKDLEARVNSDKELINKQAEELKNLEEKTELDINTIKEAKDKELADKQTDLDKIKEEYRKLVLENNDQKTLDVEPKTTVETNQ